MLQLSVDLRKKSVTSVEREIIFKELAGHNKARGPVDPRPDQNTIKKWFEFCEKHNCDAISTPLALVMSFLSELFHSGLFYCYVNTARSVLSSLLQFDDIPIPFGQFPIVKRFIIGVFEK